MVGSCRTTRFPSRDEASRTSRRVRMANQIDTTLQFCDECEAWHLVGNDKRLTEQNLRVLRLVALGLRAHEIATDVGLTTFQVQHRVKELQRVFKTISNANLVATAIWLKVIDMQPLMPQFETPAHLRDVNRKGSR